MLKMLYLCRMSFIDSVEYDYRTGLWTTSNYDVVTKNKEELEVIMSLNGRHILTEKTIDIFSEYKKSKIKNRNEWVDAEFPKFSNLKLWKLMSMAQALKQEVVRLQKFEDVAFLRDIERTSAKIILARKKSKE